MSALSARAAFEDWISGPPYERSVERFGESSAWPGNYRDIDVDLAWCAFSDAVRVTRERCAAICDAEAAERQQAAHKNHGPGTPAYGRQMAGVNAARNCAAAIRGELQPRSRGDESAAPEHPSARSTSEG